MKRCPGCGETKALDQYGRDKQKSDGLTSRCKACRSEDNRRFARSEAGRTSQRQRSRKYRLANPDACSDRTAKWRLKNPGYSAEANRKWRESNPGSAAAYHRANPEKTMERVLRRRAKIAAVTDGPIDFAALWTGTCGICATPIERSLIHPDPLSPSIDHIVPLSKGGRHSQDNLQWTHLVCNLRKGAQAA